MKGGDLPELIPHHIPDVSRVGESGEKMDMLFVSPYNEGRTPIGEKSQRRNGRD